MTTLPEEAVKAAIAAYDKYYGDLGIYPSEEPTPEGAFHAALKGALPFLSALEPSAAREMALEEAVRVAEDYMRYDVAVAIRALSSPAQADAGKVEGDGWQELEQAARNLIANRFDTYKARNGKLCSIEGDDGEKCWIVSFDDMAELEAALPAAPASEGAE